MAIVWTKGLPAKEDRTVQEKIKENRVSEI
jgi:hypothetical protein